MIKEKERKIKFKSLSDLKNLKEKYIYLKENCLNEYISEKNFYLDILKNKNWEINKEGWYIITLPNGLFYGLKTKEKIIKYINREISRNDYYIKEFNNLKEEIINLEKLHKKMLVNFINDIPQITKGKLLILLNKLVRYNNIIYRNFEFIQQIINRNDQEQRFKLTKTEFKYLKDEYKQFFCV